MNIELLELFEKRPQEIKLDLERMTQAYRELDFHKTSAPAILVAGTNGKGTTAGMLWHLCAATGLHVGLYTSPHVCCFSERIQTSHHVIDDEELIAALKVLKSELSPKLYEQLTFFEISTLLAFWVFRQYKTDLNIIEVGLGGRLDATNVIEPLLTVITSIDYDHMDFLGSTLQDIAKEKLGITRQGTPLFWGESLRSELLMPLVTEVSERKDIPLFVRGKHFKESLGKISLFFPGLKEVLCDLPALLAHRPSVIQGNFALAVGVFYWFLHHCGQLFSLLQKQDPEATFFKSIFSFGKNNLPWPMSFMGRFQKLTVDLPQGKHSFILDVCHNVASVEAFVASLAKEGYLLSHQKLPLFFTVLKDKDMDGVLNILQRTFDPLMMFKVKSSRSVTDPPQFKDRNSVVLYEDFDFAWRRALSERPDYKGPWAVCGSFLAVCEVIEYFHAYPQNYKADSVLEGSFS